MNTRLIIAALIVTGGLVPAVAPAQVTENFTGTTTTNSWTFLTGACLTAGTAATSTAANPACAGLPYYAASPQPEFGGVTGTLPDANNAGALRFTDWYAQTGAILSNFGFQLTGAGATGLQVSFTTVTYEGDHGGGGHDGADGMSFFLQDTTYPADVGAFGGSLAYTCSNVNFNGTLRGSGIPRGYDGLPGGVVGLGIDEYGNFLNQGDNTSSGYHYVPMRIGLRGPGNTTWSWLNANYPAQYPSTLTNAQGAAAVQATCRTGFVWDYSNPAAPVETAIAVNNYTAITNAFSVLPATRPLANEAATMRSQAIPITYNLTITPGGQLSLEYSYNGGALQNVITSQNIGAIPSNVRFGFAGSTGGSRNIHEIMCFQATPLNLSASSAGLNQKQTAKVQTGTQVYFAKYNPVTLAGYLTSQSLVGDMVSPNDLFISPTVNWDASCVLTGVPAGQSCASTGVAGPTPAEGNLTRVIFSWNGTNGIPFEYASLSTTLPAATATEQSLLDSGDGTTWTAPPLPTSRLDYLRGDRSNELTPLASSSATYQGVFRDRASVLGDIIDSSPTWVGPPNAPYPNAWVDKYPPAAGDPMAENAGQTYANFASTSGMLTRTNVVYTGANDGMLHGFRSGYFSSAATPGVPAVYQAATNDGYEVMAYMPGYIVNSIQTANTAASNYSDPQYGHHFDVDAPPGTGDLFYQGQWHTWLIGGLGAGGTAIYALDITNPGAGGGPNNFVEANAASTVIGEWSTQTVTTPTGPVTVNNLTCANVANCSTNLGNTYGVPQVRRFHNGSWGAVFGNGQRSATGDAGIYVMLVDPVAGPGSITFYYLGTSTGIPCPPSPPGAPGNCNGIDYTTPADLDGDHITDYVYAGDLQGNVWRFDLTSSNPTNWGVTNAGGVSINAAAGGGGSATPLFTAPGGQPITTKVVVASIAGTVNPRVLVEFGTGKQTPITNFSSGTYSTSQQSLYGIWDWNLAGWNAASTVKYTSLPGGGVAAPMSPLSGVGTLVQQTISGPFAATVAGTGSDYRTLTSLPVCYADTFGCTQFGWYINLVSGNANAADPADPQAGTGTPVVWEQVIFNPELEDGAFVVNTTIPPAAAAIMCYSAGASGWTMAVNPATGGAFTNSFFGTPTHTFLNVTTTDASGNTTTTAVSGVALGGTGSTSVVIQGTQNYLVTQTVSGVGALMSINPPGGTVGSRLTWIERR